MTSGVGAGAKRSEGAPRSHLGLSGLRVCCAWWLVKQTPRLRFAALGVTNSSMLGSG